MVKMINTPTEKKRAFTLVELLIAMGVFVVALSIATGGFLSVVRAQRAASSLMAVSDSMSVTLERMMREMRTSYNFCNSQAALFQSDDCRFVPPGGVQFVNANNIVVRYILNNDTNAIERCIGAEAGGAFSCSPVTAENVAVINFFTDLSGAGENDKRPPRVTMRFRVSSTDPQIRDMNIFTSISTTVSARCGPASLGTPEPERSCPSET